MAEYSKQTSYFGCNTTNFPSQRDFLNCVAPTRQVKKKQTLKVCPSSLRSRVETKDDKCTQQKTTTHFQRSQSVDTQSHSLNVVLQVSSLKIRFNQITKESSNAPINSSMVSLTLCHVYCSRAFDRLFQPSFSDKFKISHASSQENRYNFDAHNDICTRKTKQYLFAALLLKNQQKTFLRNLAAIFTRTTIIQRLKSAMKAMQITAAKLKETISRPK